MNIFKGNVAKVLLLMFILLVIFWLWIFSQNLTEGSINNFYGALYPLVSLVAGFYGIFVVSKKWGGVQSFIGKGVFFLSLGLLAEVFGQWAWSYFTIIKGVEVPYPSIADIGYFAIIPLYSYAMYNFAKAAGLKLGLNDLKGKLMVIITPVIMITIAYTLFLRNIPFDFSNPIKTFLDFGYPGLEPIAVTIGIITYFISRNTLGGAMRPKILFVIFALIFQFITDYLFLYQAGAGTYYNAGFVDLMYTTSFLLMSLGILSFNNIELQS